MGDPILWPPPVLLQLADSCVEDISYFLRLQVSPGSSRWWAGYANPCLGWAFHLALAKASSFTKIRARPCTTPRQEPHKLQRKLRTQICLKTAHAHVGLLPSSPWTEVQPPSGTCANCIFQLARRFLRPTSCCKSSAVTCQSEVPKHSLRKVAYLFAQWLASAPYLCPALHYFGLITCWSEPWLHGR